MAGVFQWLGLRRYLTGAVRWEPASIEAAASVAAVVLGVGVFHRDLGLLAGVGLFGALAGVWQMLVLWRPVTGTTLVWLLRRTAPDAPQSC